MKKFLILGFFIILFIDSSAQNCSQTLRLARSTYEQGRLHELPGLLDNCLKTGFNTITERVEAYKLLTLAYIYLEEPEKADETMLRILQTDHYFEVNKAVDPAEFIALYKTFRTDPIYRIGGKFGTSLSSPNVVSADNVTDAEIKYSPRFGFSGAVAAELPFSIKKNKAFTFNPELCFQITSFNYSGSDSVHKSTAPRTQDWISLPLSVQYQFSQSKFNPYVAVGFETAYLFASKVNGQSTRKSNASIELKSFDVKKIVNNLNYSVMLSVGGKYKIGKGLAVAELRYHQGLRNVTRIDGTYANQFLTWDYHATDAVYKLNYVSLTVGYMVNIFSPKKLTLKK